MENLNYLFAAYTAIWTCLFLYMLRIAGKLGSLRREIDVMKEQ